MSRRTGMSRLPLTERTMPRRRTVNLKARALVALRKAGIAPFEPAADEIRLDFHSPQAIIPTKTAPGYYFRDADIVDDGAVRVAFTYDIDPGKVQLVANELQLQGFHITQPRPTMLVVRRVAPRSIERITDVQIGGHRNGPGNAEHYYLVSFNDVTTGQRLGATVLANDKPSRRNLYVSIRTVVFDPRKVQIGVVSFGDNSFDAEWFDADLRQAIQDWEDGR